METNYPPYQSAIPLCKDHSEEELDSYCFTCKWRICEECCRGDHKDHDWRRSKKAAKEIRENSGDRCERIEGMISGLEQDNGEEADIERIEEIKIEYKCFIDDWAERMKAKRRGCRKKNTMTKEIQKLKKMLRFYDKEVQSVKDSVALEVEEEFHTLQENISELNINTEKKKLKFKEGNFSPDVLLYMLGDVMEEKSESKIKVTEMSHFTHVDDSTFINSIVPVARDKALIRRFKSTQIDHVDMTGRVIKERKLPTACEDFIMMNNDIIYSHAGNMMIRRISSSGTVSDVHSTAPLHPCGISTSRDGGILVTLCDCYMSDITSSSRGQILHINTKGEVIRRCDQTEDHTEKALVHPYRVAQNINMDICVVNILDKEYRCSLLVLSNAFEFKFSYTGQPTLKHIFESDDVDCDNRGRLLVTDCRNHAVHLLREDGHFLEFILTEESFMRSPRCLGLYDSTLWVGCNKGVVRVYKYNADEY